MKISPKKLAIMAAGGPAPGINSVIAAATIRASLEDIDVLGILDGFKWIMRGVISHVRPLHIDTVSRIHFRGGSYIGIARDNPTYDPKLMEQTVTSLLRLDVDKLITIGGDGTAYTAAKIEEIANGRIKVVHVPKTIDNDLDLPHGLSTFGYQTARHHGCEIIKNLMVDAHTTSRWYFVVSMGRKAGHLALGIGNAAAATISLIAEEFNGPYIRLQHIVDILAGSIIKRLSYGRRDGVAILAEGLVEHLHPEDLEKYFQVKRDPHGNIKLGRVNFGEVLQQQVEYLMSEFRVDTTVVSKNIGYELRCADPIPFDMEYTRNLGSCAAEHILNGGNRVMVSIERGHFRPLPFEEIMDKETGRAKMRMVDITSEAFATARRYMIRLNEKDFADPHAIAKYAATCGVSIDDFEKRFRHLIDDDKFLKIKNAKRKTTKNKTKKSADAAGE